MVAEEVVEARDGFRLVVVADAVGDVDVFERVQVVQAQAVGLSGVGGGLDGDGTRKGGAEVGVAGLGGGVVLVRDGAEDGLDGELAGRGGGGCGCYRWGRGLCRCCGLRRRVSRGVSQDRGICGGVGLLRASVGGEGCEGEGRERE